MRNFFVLMCSSAQTIGKGSVALRWQVCVRSRRDGGAGAAEIRCSVRTWTVPPGGFILIVAIKLLRSASIVIRPELTPALSRQNHRALAARRVGANAVQYAS